MNKTLLYICIILLFLVIWISSISALKGTLTNNQKNVLDKTIKSDANLPKLNIDESKLIDINNIKNIKNLSTK